MDELPYFESLDLEDQLRLAADALVVLAADARLATAILVAADLLEQLRSTLHEVRRPPYSPVLIEVQPTASVAVWSP